MPLSTREYQELRALPLPSTNTKLFKAWDAYYASQYQRVPTTEGSPNTKYQYQALSTTGCTLCCSVPESTQALPVPRTEGSGSSSTSKTHISHSAKHEFRALSTLPILPNTKLSQSPKHGMQMVMLSNSKQASSCTSLDH